MEWERIMIRKITFYGLSAVVFATFLYLSGWGEFKFPGDALRADAVEETDVQYEKVAFITDYDEALSKAARENKPAMLFFMANNCRFSEEMLAEAFVDPDVERLAQDFVCVELDVNAPENREICEQYNVIGSPTIQFITSRGDLLQRLASAQSGQRLADQMQAALSSAAWRAARAENSALLR